MKKGYLLLFLFFLYCFSASAQNIAINSTGNAANSSAGLDVDFTNRGLLIPRVSLTATTDATTIATPATSLLVYNSNAAMTGGSGVGYYYNAGTSGAPNWVRLLTTGSNWLLTGNAGTTAGTNFLGTTDAQDVVIKANNAEGLRVLSGGISTAFGVGTTVAPTTTSGWGSFIGRSTTSNFQINLQDGSRTALLWNASGTGGNYLVTGEPAVRQRFHIATGGYIDFAGAPAGTAGSPITWTTMGAMESSNYTWFSPRGTSSDFYIPATTGYIGMGTTAPGYPLELVNSSNLLAKFRGTGANNTQVMIDAVSGWNSNLTFMNGGTSEWYLGNRASDNRFSWINAGGSTEAVTILQGGNVGIGTIAPGAKLSFQDMNNGANTADGITWYNPSPTAYGIFRSAGAWSAPNYQQLNLGWQTGVVIDGGSLYGKSGTNIQPGAGNVALGTSAQGVRKLEINSGAGDAITFGQELDNTQTIQTYIDGQWSNRATYAGGCCNALAIQPDVGTVGIGTTAPTQKLDVRGNIALPNNGSQIIFPEASGNTSYHGLMDNNGFFADGVPWYGGFGREPGAWAYPYPDVVISNHTGLRLDAHSNYGGISFYEQLNAAGTAWSSTGNEIARFRDDRWGGSYFKTKLGVGNASPSATLDVTGTFKLVDGTQGAGRVLVSDASGNASWQTTSNLMQVYTVPASQTSITGYAYVQVTGLSQTIVTTKTSYFIINTTGSLESQGGSGSWTGTKTCLANNGTCLTEQGNDIVNPTSPSVFGVITHWGINYTQLLPAGTYTFTVSCKMYNGTAGFYAGGASTSGLPNDGTMTIQVIPQ